MSKKIHGIFAVIDYLFDHVLAPIRILLLPFSLLTKLGEISKRAIWTLSNEYTKLLFGKCGKGVRIHGRFHVTAPKNVLLGNNIHINDNAFIRAEGGLSIGDNTHISRNLVLYTMNHNYKGVRLPYDDKQVLKPVHIGRNVWVGMNVTITPGTTIGDGAILGMGTTASGDIPRLSIVGSTSHHTIKVRDESHYNKLDRTEQYSGMSGKPWTDQ